MKYIFMGLIGGLAIILGVNIGLQYGLTSKPVLDIEKCLVITRDQSGNLICGRVLQAEDEGHTDQHIFHNVPQGYQPTVSADTLQPARQEAR